MINKNYISVKAKLRIKNLAEKCILKKKRFVHFITFVQIKIRKVKSSFFVVVSSFDL